MTYYRFQTDAERSRLDSLTGFRFIAALFVFFFHASLTKIVGFNPYADPAIITIFQTTFSSGGWVGVSFFFVLSGFVLAWSARADDTVVAFWRRRIVKIYPNHVVTWLLAMLVFSGPVTAASAAIPNLLLVHTWIPDINIFLGVNGPSWSLCCELFFYLLFPFAFRLIEAIPANRLWAWAGVMVAGLALCQFGVSRLVPGEPQIAQYPISLDQWWFAYFFPPFRLFEFTLGMLMARILKAGLWPHIGVVPSLVFMAAGYAASTVVAFQYSLNLVTLVPIAVLITALADQDINGRTTSFLASRLMVKLGEISFGFYMIHLVIMTCATKVLGGRLFDAPLASIIVAVTLIVSVFGGWLLFTFIEQPAMRRWGRARKVEKLVEAI